MKLIKDLDAQQKKYSQYSAKKARNEVFWSGRKMLARSLERIRENSRRADVTVDQLAAPAPNTDFEPLDVPLVAKYVNELDEKSRQVIQMFDSGLTDRQVAEHLGISAAYVGRKRTAGVEWLRQKLRVAEVIALVVSAWRSTLVLARAGSGWTKRLNALVPLMIFSSPLGSECSRKPVAAERPAVLSPLTKDKSKYLNCEVTFRVLGRTTELESVVIAIHDSGKIMEYELFGVELLPQGTALNPKKGSYQSQVRGAVMRATTQEQVKAIFVPSSGSGPPRLILRLANCATVNQALVEKGLCFVRDEAALDNTGRKLHADLQWAEEKAKQEGRGMCHVDD